MLQKYLNKLAKDGQAWRTTERAWEKIMVAKDRTLSRDIQRAPNATMLDGKLLDRIQLTIQGKSGPGRGNRDLSTPKRTRDLRADTGKGIGKGNGKSRGKGSGKGVPNLTELTIAEDIFLTDEDNEPLIRFEPDQLDEESRGYFCCNGQAAADVLEMRMRMDALAYPCVLVVKHAAMDATRSTNIRRLKGFFNPIKIKPLWKDEHGETYNNVDCLCFNLGQGAVNFET